MSKLIFTIITIIGIFVSIMLLFGLSIDVITSADTTTETTNAVGIMNDIVSFMPEIGLFVGAVIFIIMTLVVLQKHRI